LPGRDVPFYRQVLARCLSRLTLDLAAGEPSPADRRAVLELVTASLVGVEARWAVVENICGPLPSVLVHGDYVPKNLAVDPGDGGVLRPLDWETAGSGLPATDLAELAAAWPQALAAYTAFAGPPVPAISGVWLPAIVGVGRVLRVIMAIDWATEALALRGHATIFGKLQTYAAWLNQALATEPWSGHAPAGARPGGSRARS
jgi:thiamine kinase-like enzyme